MTSSRIESPPKERLSRLIDAAANRAREGLRVAEDYSRFILDDAETSSRIKALRHEITEACALILPYAEGLSARESELDVGRSQSAGEEKASLKAVLTANLKRAQEALRSLEEFSKLAGEKGASASSRFKEIRYQLYTLEKNFPPSKG